MEENKSKNAGGIIQEEEALNTWQPGEGPRAIIEYLFSGFSYGSGPSDEKAEPLSEEDENAIARVLHFFLQARYEASSAEAKRCMESPYPEIRIFAMLAYAVNCVAKNDIKAAREIIESMQHKTQLPESKRVSALNDVYRFVLSVFFHLADETAQLPLDQLPYCSSGSRFYSLYAWSYALYLQQEYAQALGVAEATLAMAGDRHPIIRIYLNLAASMAAINLFRFDQADRFFLNALKIAKPTGYIQPFIGHHGPLQGLVEKHIRDREPELYKLISENVTLFRRGWTEIHNPLSSNKVTNLLTPYEFALAMMAAKGKSNQDISDYLNISINTVKAHLSTIYQKVGVTKRSELKKCLNK